jgi:predicted enzyme related to lactoylglutathione lyase
MQTVDKFIIAFLFLISFLFSQYTFSQISKGNPMKIIHTKIFVNDQDKALKFYTETLGFVKKSDVTRGEYRWLTVVSPADQDGTELILEKNDNPAAKTYQTAIFEQHTPATMFGVADVQAEYEQLKSKGVRFTMEPTDIGPAIIGIFDDTCGNLIQISQFK